MKRREIPIYGLGEYRRTELSERGIFVGTIEDAIARRYHRPHPHSHPFFQAFLLWGSGKFMHDFRRHAVEGPTVVFTTPGQVHALDVAPRLHCVFVSFTQEFVDDKAPPPSRLLEFPFFFAPDRPPLLRLDRVAAADFRRLFAAMLEEFNSGLPGAAEVVRSFLQIALTRAARLYLRRHRSAHDDASRPSRLVRAFRLAVENRFAEITSLGEYAKLLQVTPNHLNDTLREKTGQAAGALIRQRRLLEAKRLLSHSDLTVSEIGYRLRFRDPSHFGRFFRLGAGTTPAAFREKIREKYQRSAP